MGEDELAARREARRRELPPVGAAQAATMTVEEIGREMSLAYLVSQRAVALEEPEVKLEILWRDVERWTEAYISAVRKRRDE